MSTRWSGAEMPRGDDYDDRWKRLGARGENIHGEADLVEWLLRRSGGRRVLDAGCGTGRVAIELAARGFDVAGVDLDAGMMAAARGKAPELEWIVADLTTLDDAPGLPGAARGAGFDLVVMAGNVMIFVAPGTEAAVVAAVRAQLRDGGLLVAGFQLRPDRISLAENDRFAAAAGLELAERWATWDREPYVGGDYAVSVHRVVR
jgi:SAM-dependent methyltransferase